MFIVTYPDGSQLKESDGITWDDVPTDNPISSVEIPIPHKDTTAVFKDADGYYCMREAVSLLSYTGDAITTPHHQVVAQILGALYNEDGNVHEVRIDTEGNVTERFMPLNHFRASFIDPTTRQGSFDPSIIKPGK